MHQSILLPVGSSDFDGPDLVVIPWGEEQAGKYQRRIERARQLAEENLGELTCVRFINRGAAAFQTPDEDGEWLERIEEIHAGNDLLGVQESTEYFLERWTTFQVPMPDPVRASFYPEAGIFFSGPIGLSALRWESSCGIILDESGLVAPSTRADLSQLA